MCKVNRVREFMSVLLNAVDVKIMIDSLIMERLTGKLSLTIPYARLYIQNIHTNHAQHGWQVDRHDF